MPDVADLVVNNDDWGEGELTYSRLFSGKFFFYFIFFLFLVPQEKLEW